MITSENGFFLNGHRTAAEKLFKAVFHKPRAYMNAGQVELAMLKDYIPAGSTTIDVGANVGTFSRRLSQLSDGGLVVAFEPQSMPRSVMTVAGFMRGRSRIMVLPLALGAQEGMVTLSVPIKKSRNIGVGLAHIGSDADFEGRFEVKKELVTLTRLDTVLKNIDTGRISFIKIDVEGGELDVLRGGVETIETHRPAILCEVESHQGRFDSTVEELAGFFRERGYVARSIATGDVLPFDELEHNTVFTPD